MPESTNEYMSQGEGTLGGDEQRGGDAEVETVEIRAEIRETRERMGDTLEQLGERLNPSHLKEQAKQDLRDATIGKVEHMTQNAVDRVDEARRTMMDTIRENPVPAIMAGVGLGWLFYNASREGSGGMRSTSGRSGMSRNRPAYARGYAGEYGSGLYGTSGYGTTGYAGTEYETGYGYGAGTSAGSSGEEQGTLGHARERAGELADSAKETAGEMADRAQHMAGRVGDRAQHMAHDVARETRFQARRLEDQFYESPLAIGAATLALGVVAGLSIPETRKESQLMGGARDQLADKVRDVARETKDKAEHVADRVVDQAQSTAKQAAQQEGLISP